MHSEHCTHGPNCSRKPKFWKVYMVVGTNRAWIGTTGATTAAEAVRYFAKRRPGVRLVAERDIWTSSIFGSMSMMYSYLSVAIIPDHLLDKVLNAAGRPSVGRPRAEVEYAKAFAEKLRQYGHCDTCGAECDKDGCVVDRNHEFAITGVADYPATITAAYRQVGETLEAVKSQYLMVADCRGTILSREWITAASERAAGEVFRNSLDRSNLLKIATTIKCMEIRCGNEP